MHEFMQQLIKTDLDQTDSTHTSDKLKHISKRMPLKLAGLLPLSPIKNYEISLMCISVFEWGFGW